MDIKSYKDYLVKWLQDTVDASSTSGLIVGVSGGIDSALVANLIKEAFPNNHLGVIIPIETSSTDMEDAYEFVKKCGITHTEKNMDDVYNEFVKLHNYEKTTSLANTKARLRMIQLYALASEYNYLVVGTDNKCEWYTGYFTKYGDGGVDIAPLVHLNKSQVYEMAKLYDVPTSIMEKSPSAGLGISRTDEEEMGVTYDTIDSYLDGDSISSSDVEIIEKLHRVSMHKRKGITFPEKKN